MSLLVLDQDLARELRADRKARGIDQHDEVWEGVYVMSPIADDSHQRIVSKLTYAFEQVIGETGLGDVRPGINVSDRIAGWKKNFRTPDVVVILKNSSAENHGTFWTGALDFVVEVISRGDRSQKKLPFYSKIGVREALFVERNPWRLLLYRHDGSKLQLVDECAAVAAPPVSSEVLPFSFGLVGADEGDRPLILLRHITDDRTWRA
jgi:Uma2 family endonuclease